MSQDNRETPQDKASTPQGRPSKKDVDLFPALAERRVMPMVSSRVVPANSGPQISMFNPASFDDALDIVECLRTRSAATICLDSMRRSDASRLVDFVTGASAAIDGDFHKMSEQVYLFCPSNFKITASRDAEHSNSNPLDFLYNNTRTLDNGSLGNFWSRS